MHFKGLDLNLLVALEALLDENSVTRAAHRLGILQPAMSGALQRLRYHFSDALLERVGRRMEHTPKAATLHAPLRALLIDIRRTLESFPMFDPSTSQRSFRVAMSSFTAELLAPQLARLVAAEAPSVEIELQYVTSDMFQRLNSGTMDCCITVNDRTLFDPTFLQDEFLSCSLFADSFVLAVGEKSPAFCEALDYDTFCHLPLIVVRVGENVRSIVERVLDRQIRRPAAAFVVPSYSLALEMAAGSNLVTIARSRIAARRGRQGGLRLLPVPLALPVLEEALIWHSRSEIDPAQQWLREIIRKTVQLTIKGSD